MTVRAGEALESDFLAELPVGTGLEVLEVGEIPRRARIVARVGTDSVEGWISIRTRLNEPLISKRAPDFQIAMADFEVGGQHEVQSLVTLRAGEDLASEVITDLKPGTQVRIKELGKINKRRGKVETDGVLTVEGWISLATRQGDLLVGKVSSLSQESQPGDTRKSFTAPSGSMFGTSSNKIKTMLEAARQDDLEALMRLVEGGTGFMGKLSSRPNLNCSDIRGKTALIYAAAFGGKATIEYLLTKRSELDVNALDDTQKSALHHASKRSRKSRGASTAPGVQGEIVKLLLDAGALIEARDHNGCTPLMFAVANGDEPVAQLLLRAGATVNVTDYEGHTPLDYARNFGYYQLAKLLLTGGAYSEDTQDDQGRAEAELPEATQVEQDGTILSSPLDSPAAAKDAPAAKKKMIPVRRKSKLSSTSKDSKTSGGSDEPAEKSAAADEAAGTPLKKRVSVAKVKAKAKGKAKVKAKAKGKPGSPIKSNMAMAAMVAELEGARDSVAVVEVLDVKEEADEKELAMDKLNAILASATLVVGEIEAAINIAKSAGVEEGQLEEASNKVKELKQKAIAQDHLRMLIDSPSVDGLMAAIAEAERSGVPTAEIAKAKEALELEIPKQKARDVLKAAQDSGNTALLREAVAGARKVQLTDEEISPFEELLAGAESKEKATSALKAAIKTRDVAQLKFSIQQAKEAGVDPEEVATAQGILEIEEPKAKAREVIAEAIQKDPIDVAALEAAVAIGQKAKLDPSEYAECVDMVKKEAEKAKALQEVIGVMESVKDVDMTSIEDIGVAKKKLSDAITMAKEIGVAEALLNEFELRRRKLHNAIEDLKGSIRVFCRARPMTQKDTDGGHMNIVRRVDCMTVAIADKDSTEAAGIKKDHEFSFDAVFMPGTQEEVFEDCRDLVQSAADGYNVTLFAYGQTGAGKTYTMGGTTADPGISRRTIDEIFRLTKEGSARYNYTVMGSMIELYRQDLFDLIAVARQGRDSVKKLQVRTTKELGVLMDGLLEEECKDADQLEALMDEGSNGRKTLSTGMNEHSSRSHMLFIVRIVSVNRETHERLNGKISIVDLAGSERLSKSQVTGEGAKEAIEINKSLTSLGDVIEALTKNAKQIPYRNHKLTMVMQDCIGGTSKTLMFVNISPSMDNVGETMMSLKYATRAKKITNTNKKQKAATASE